MKFQVVSDYQPKGDQPQAIEKLARGIVDGEKFQTLLNDKLLGAKMEIELQHLQEAINSK